MQKVDKLVRKWENKNNNTWRLYFEKKTWSKGVFAKRGKHEIVSGILIGLRQLESPYVEIT